MSLVDANGNSMPQAEEAPPATNGAAKKGIMDVRTVPTGQLIFNLIRAAGEEIGVGNAIQQVKAMKEQQKMVADPPQLEAMMNHLATMERYRYIIANEINERFKGIDQQRITELGIVITEPPAE